jgi:hypothetical protein
MKCAPGLALLTTLATLPAQAYSVILDSTDSAIRWGASPVSWYLAGASADVPTADVEAALKASFQPWQDVGCSAISFTYGGQKSNPTSGIAVTWRESSWDFTTGDALAVTTNWKLSASGASRVEIIFNGVDFTWATSGGGPFSEVEDIADTATHEIGHAIGLDHSRDPSATMWFTAQPGIDGSTLAADDERGVCFLYPSVSFAAGQVCDACLADANCAVGVCIGYGPGEGGYCGKGCSSSADCAAGFACYSFNDGSAPPQCLPDNMHCAPLGANIEVGDFCYDNPTCASGTCLTTTDSAVCTTGCTVGGSNNGGCPASMTCLANGSSGICYPKGQGQLGDSCVGSFECANFDCASVGGGKGACTQDCSSDAGCPSAFRCLTKKCLPRGPTAFGGSCSSGVDCVTAVCWAAKCSDECAVDADCPGESTCSSSGFCKPGPTGGLKAACGEGAETCTSAYFCLFEAVGLTTGRCEVSCDTRVDKCASGQLCRRYYQSWNDKVVGVCTDDVSGASESQPCGAAVSCQAGLVCADLGDGDARCRRDCHAKNLLGCTSNEQCVPLGDLADPKLGACRPLGAPVTPDADGPTGGSDVGSSGAVDAGSGTADDASGAADAVSPSGDTTPPAAEADAGAKKGGRNSGGCTTGQGGGGALWLFLTLAALAWRLTRRRPSTAR